MNTGFIYPIAHQITLLWFLTNFSLMCAKLISWSPLNLRVNFSILMEDVYIFLIVQPQNRYFYCIPHTSWLHIQQSIMLHPSILLPLLSANHIISPPTCCSLLYRHWSSWSSLNRQNSTLWPLHSLCPLPGPSFPRYPHLKSFPSFKPLFKCYFLKEAYHELGI